MQINRLLQAILNNTSEGVLGLDPDGIILSWNHVAERITGYRKEEVVGKKCFRLPHASICGANCPVSKALNSGRPHRNAEIQIRNKVDQVIHLLVNVVPVYEEDGALAGGLETFREVSQTERGGDESWDEAGYHNIVGNSEAMRNVYDLLSSLITTDTTVLVQGESGTGKELVARALHFHGPRRDKPFIPINCSALPEGMLESELFGHVKGSFTGAVRNHVGKFELADGGTLFLDEIGEISEAMQVKLLRVLEEREFQRIGDNRTIKVDLRLVTATNKDLYKRVREGAFRADLYYRLSVFPVDLPPLRERIDDLPLLVDHFVRRFNSQMGKKIHGLADGALDALEAHYWPGNVRELANTIEYAFVHSKGVLIHPSDLPPNILNAVEEKNPSKAHGGRRRLDEVEREMILHELQAASWKKNEAARRLGMSRTTLWRKMEKHTISIDNASSGLGILRGTQNERKAIL